MKLLSYDDSYHFYGLWDYTMRIWKDGKLIPLHEERKSIDFYNMVGTQDALHFYIVNAENVSLGDICYLKSNITFKNDKSRAVKKDEIEITYYSKEFEKHIPAIMKMYQDKDYLVKITFIYQPEKEENFFNNEKLLNELIKCGWIDEDYTNEILMQLKTA